MAIHPRSAIGRVLSIRAALTGARRGWCHRQMAKLTCAQTIERARQIVLTHPDGVRITEINRIIFREHPEMSASPESTDNYPWSGTIRQATWKLEKLFPNEIAKDGKIYRPRARYGNVAPVTSHPSGRAPYPEREYREGEIGAHEVQERKRSRQARKDVIANRRGRGSLTCEGCDRSPVLLLHGPAGEEAMYEVHHLNGLNENRPTRMSDFALLCGTCHRVMHHLIQRENRWYSVAHLRKVLKTGAPRAL
jgi:predicted HNH restriction endonuclease